MRRLVVFVVSIVVLAALVWFGGRWLLGRSVAAYEGEVVGQGLAHPVEITYDAKGIPQIWAQTDPDLYYALGWVHASERLFQMELLRRLAAGELSELFGEEAYETDVFQRRVGFARQARRDLAGLRPEHAALLQRYADGVNAWVEAHRILPPEFVLLGHRPRPWQVVDCLSIALYQTWFSHALMDHDLAYRRLIEALGDDAARLLEGAKPWSPATVSPATVPDGFLRERFGRDDLPLRMTEASNAWAVAPARSASGAALHAADPHLAVNQAPGLWYVAGLHSAQGTNVLGVTVPGLPSVAMGHNGAISFSFTVASVDVVDYYRERLDPADSTRVLRPGGSVPVERIEERIRVEGEAEARSLVVARTPNGVVVDRDSAGLVVLRWAGHDFSAADVVASGLALNRAQTFDAFRRAVTGLGALDANWTYADRAGNIGYQLGAPVPVREGGTFTLREGADSLTAWRGYRPLAETPYVLNPERGWLASCNNQIVPADWPYPLPGFYDPYRIVRAEALLGARDVFSRSDMEATQRDRRSAVALRWKELAARGALRAGEPDAAAALRAWDGTMAEESPEAALFAYWWHALTRPLFEDELGDDWEDGRSLQEEVLTEELEGIVDDRRTEAIREDVVDLSAQALATALDRAAGRSWGEVSTLTVAHPLGRVAILDAWLDLDRGPVPMGGDPGTLDANFYRFDSERGRFATLAAPSMRFVMDWSDVDGFTINPALGQSGNPLSPHYDDFFAFHRAGERWTVPFTREKVYARRTSLLRLVPAAE